MSSLKKEICSGQSLIGRLKEGVNKLADTVKITMGPRGRLVIIQRDNQHPTITKDPKK